MNTVAYHHVHLCANPVDLSPEDKQTFFDEASRQIVSVTAKGICVTPLEGENKGVRTYQRTLQSNILCAKFSPDQKYMAVQFSPLEIEFTNIADNITFIHSCKKSRGTILNFFWTYTDNFLLITTQYVELYQFPKIPKRGGQMKLMKDIKCASTWLHYSSRHRIVLVSNSVPVPASTITPSNSSTPPCTSSIVVYPFYFKPNTIIKMSRFEVENDGRSPLSSQELVVHKLYDAIYCIHVHCYRKELVLYHLTKEIVVRKIRLDLLTAGISYIHVVDNLLLVHNIESKLTMMFDIKCKNRDIAGFPVASPLPLSLVPYIPNQTATPEPATKPVTFSPSLSVPSFSSQPLPLLMYSQNWEFYLPSYIVDRSVGLCWSVGLNLDGIVLSLSDRCRLVEFLLRRTLPRAKSILLRELLSMIVEHESIAVVALVFDSINAVLAEHLKAGNQVELHATPAPKSNPSSSTTNNNNNNNNNNSNSSLINNILSNMNRRASRDAETDWTLLDYATSDNVDHDEIPQQVNLSHTQPYTHQSHLIGLEGVVAIAQTDMYQHVFVAVEERDPHDLDIKYIISVITEYIRSLNFHHINVKHFLYETLIDFLVRNNRWYQLHQFLQYHVVSDSTHVACRLLSLEGTYPPAYQLALDMMKRLSTHDQIVEVLLSKKLILSALRFIKSHKVKFSPKRVLEAALQTGDSTIFFHVYHYYEVRKELTEDCEQCCRAGKDMFAMHSQVKKRSATGTNL